jgi:hypothetical protein
MKPARDRRIDDILSRAAFVLGPGAATGPTASSGASSPILEMTLAIRVRVPADAQDAPIAADFGADGQQRFLLSVRAGTRGKSILCQFFTDYGDVPFCMDMSLDTIGADRWHDITARFVSHHAALFIDGLLVDEEWPIGSLKGGGPGRFLVGSE